MVRHGDWIQTANGRQFWPLDPRPEDVHIDDIAHALSMLCRFGGHCRRFYSVAEHCILLALQAPIRHKLWALLHDAAEAYLVDVPRPIKHHLDGYKEAEARIMRVVCTRFGLDPDMPGPVAAADNAILMDEARQNMAPCVVPWGWSVPPLGVELQYWSPPVAKLEFLKSFALYTAAQESG